MSGPNYAPLAPTPFEAFVKVPRFLRPHTQIYCTSEWVFGNREDLVKDVISELQPEQGEAGIALGELQSVRDLYDFSSIATLFLIRVATVTPTLISKNHSE